MYSRISDIFFFDTHDTEHQMTYMGYENLRNRDGS